MKKNNITVKDIAEAVNTSMSTVSRALNNHPKISMETKEKIWMAAKKLGYKPNLPAYMNPETTKTICILTPDLKGRYIQSVIEGAQKTALSEGYNLYIATSQKNIEIEKGYLNSVINLNMEGVISVIFDRTADLSHQNKLLKLKVPVVYLHRSDMKQTGTTIIPDIFDGTFKAVNHLFSMGNEDIILISGNPKEPFYYDMIDGFKTAFSMKNRTIDKDRILTDIARPSDLLKYLDFNHKKGQLPDAYILPNETLSQTLLYWANEKGLKIPEHLSLIHFTDSTGATGFNAHISSVEFSGNEIGSKAAQELFLQIHNKKLSQNTIVIPSKFIIKGSTLKLGSK